MSMRPQFFLQRTIIGRYWLGFLTVHRLQVSGISRGRYAKISVKFILVV